MGKVNGSIKANPKGNETFLGELKNGQGFMYRGQYHIVANALPVPAYSYKRESYQRSIYCLQVTQEKPIKLPCGCLQGETRIETKMRILSINNIVQPTELKLASN